jgi:hypothetical protein
MKFARPSVHNFIAYLGISFRVQHGWVTPHVHWCGIQKHAVEIIKQPTPLRLYKSAWRRRGILGPYPIGWRSACWLEQNPIERFPITERQSCRTTPQTTATRICARQINHLVRMTRALAMDHSHTAPPAPRDRLLRIASRRLPAFASSASASRGCTALAESSRASAALVFLRCLKAH